MSTPPSTTACEPRSSRTAWPLLLPLLFGIVVVAFGGATTLTELRAAAIDRYATDIAEHCAPATEELSEARHDLVRLRAQLREVLDANGRVQAVDLGPVDDLQSALDSALRRYGMSASGDVGQRDGVRQIDTADASLQDAIREFRARVAAGNAEQARETLDGVVATRGLALDGRLARALDSYADRSHESAAEIRRLRTSSTQLAIWLDGLSALVALGAAVVLQRAVRSHAALLTTLHRLSDERATELDSFAGRVAHDIRGPLNVVALSFDLLRSQAPQAAATTVARARRAVDRMIHLVDGLLAFARAGAQPPAGTHTAVEAAISDVVDQLHDAADMAEAQLIVDLDDDLAVRCPAAIVTSIVFNLASNAIKFLEGAPEKRVVIRGRRESDMIRVAVEDTGPGFPAPLKDRIFEPFVRGVDGTRDGVGLGLATVRRFAEGCGGSAGGENNTGAGCTFWVLLPAAKP